MGKLIGLRLRERIRAALGALKNPDAAYLRGYVDGVRDYPRIRAGVEA